VSGRWWEVPEKYNERKIRLKGGGVVPCIFIYFEVLVWWVEPLGKRFSRFKERVGWVTANG